MTFLGAVFRAVILSLAACSICGIFLSILLDASTPLGHVLSILRGILFDLAALQVYRPIRSGLRILKVLDEDHVLHRTLLKKVSKIEYRSLEKRVPSKALRGIVTEYPLKTSTSVKNLVRAYSTLREPLHIVVLDLLQNIRETAGEDIEKILREKPYLLFKSGTKIVRDIVTLSAILRLTPIEIVALSLDKNLLKAVIFYMLRHRRGIHRKLLLDIYEYTFRGPDRDKFTQYALILSGYVKKLAAKGITVTGRYILTELEHDIKTGTFRNRYTAMLYRYVPIDLLRELLHEYSKRVYYYYHGRVDRARRELLKARLLLRLL